MSLSVIEFLRHIYDEIIYLQNEIDELELQIKTIIDRENDNWLTASYKQPDVE